MLQYVKQNELPFAVPSSATSERDHPYLQSNLVVEPEQFTADLFALSRRARRVLLAPFWLRRALHGSRDWRGADGGAPSARALVVPRLVGATNGAW